MRKAILTILMAATAATPALAQDNDGGWRGRGHRDGGQSSEQRSEARAERIEQRSEARAERSEQRQQAEQQRVERQAAPQQQTEARSWQGRSGGSWQRGENQQPAVQVQQQAQVRTEAYRGSR